MVTRRYYYGPQWQIDYNGGLTITNNKIVKDHNGKWITAPLILQTAVIDGFELAFECNLSLVQDQHG